MVKIDYAIQTSERTRNRLPLLENWTRHVQAPSTVRFVSDEHVGSGTYLSAIDKTIYALDTFQPHYDWLYIVDDDGYVVPRRLELRLIDLDPDEHHAIGCVQGVLSNDTHKFPSIHGGCGYALSRATALALQQRHWHGELVRHHRSSDGTVAMNLHHIRVIPTGDERFSDGAPKDETTFIACHKAKLEDYARLNSAQAGAEPSKEGYLRKPNEDAVNVLV
jgi:hypothetical protein